MALLAAAACVPAEVDWRAQTPPGHVEVRQVMDTVRVRRLDVPDSVSLHGVQTVRDLAARAVVHDRAAEAETLVGLLQTLPDSLLAKDLRIPRATDSIIYRTQRQGWGHRFDLMRADVFRVQSVEVDTIRVSLPSGGAERWQVVRVSGIATADPSFGRRDEHSPSP